MRVYANVGLILAGFVILNEILFLAAPALAYAIFGPTEVTGFLTRAKGVFLEPSEAALYLLPPLVYFYLKRRYAPLVTILIATLVTFSGLTYISLSMALLMIIYLDKGKPLKFLLLPIFALLIVLVASSSPQIVQRVDDIVGLNISSEINFREMNSSLATIVMNAMVAMDSLVNSYFLGIGFGNFEYGFNQNAWMHFPAGYVDEEGMFWNRGTGGGLLVRVTAELGVIGLATLAYVLYREIKAYAALRGLPSHGSDNYGDVQAYVITSIVMFVVSLLRKDALTNVHLFIFLAGALMLRTGLASRQSLSVDHLSRKRASLRFRRSLADEEFDGLGSDSSRSFGSAANLPSNTPASKRWTHM